jgi:hypothetical protein
MNHEPIGPAAKRAVLEALRPVSESASARFQLSGTHPRAAIALGSLVLHAEHLEELLR